MQVLDAYWADLEESRQIDFEMILRFAYDLISTVPSIAILLSQMFRFILVDEYQDTKEIQYGIIASIMRAGAGRSNAFIVGDANQIIFGSLGGYAITREQFCNAQFAAKSLLINYRSSERIVGYFGNYHVVPVVIRAEGNDRNFANLITSDDTQSQDLDDESSVCCVIASRLLGYPPEYMHRCAAKDSARCCNAQTCRGHTRT
jgi:hypothetical protein